MTGTIGNIGDKFLTGSLWITQQSINSFNDNFYNVNILPFVETADIVGITRLTIVENNINSTSMIHDIKPVTNILTLSIDRQGLAVADIVNNEDIYTYDVKVSYAKKDNYKVELVNTVNNHEQIILRNSDGVYVVTPRINKSFKFQSDWPYNNSQVYLLGPILEDINGDNERVFEEVNDGYKVTVSANYPNNPKLVKQEILFDKDSNIKKITVIDKDGNAEITMNFDKIDLDSKFNNDYFDLKNIIDVKEENTDNKDNSNIDGNTNTETKQTSSIDDVIYPMYLPVNTYLTNSEKVNKNDGERLILTFDGDNPFMLIEETLSYEEEHLIVPTYGELELMASTVAIVNENSVNWIDNNMEYYVVSDKLSKSELLEIARSISVLPVSK